MKRFLSLGLSFLITYPSLSFGAQTHEHEEKIKTEYSNTYVAAIKKFASKNKRNLIISSLWSTIATKTIYELILKNKKLSALTTSVTGAISFAAAYYVYQEYLDDKLKNAITIGDYQLTKKFIEYGANVNATFINSNGRSNCPLLEASQANYELIQLLLDNGAKEDLIEPDITKHYYFGNKQDRLNLALFNAIENNKTEQVKYLIYKDGCLLDFTIEDQQYSPMLLAQNSNLEIMKLIIQSIDPAKLDITSLNRKHYDELGKIYLKRLAKETSSKYQEKKPINEPATSETPIIEQNNEQTLYNEESSEEEEEEQDEDSPVETRV